MVDACVITQSYTAECRISRDLSASVEKGHFCISERANLYQSGQGNLAMIVEAEWNRRLGRGFNSRRLHHEHTGSGVLLRGATWVRLGAIKARLRLG